MKHPGILTAASEVDFCAWLDQASPGDRLEYHRGFLMIDRVPRSRLPESERQQLVRIADRAMWSAEQGLVHLVQHRHAPVDYSYLAIARPWPDTPRGDLRAALAEELPE